MVKYSDFNLDSIISQFINELGDDNDIEVCELFPVTEQLLKDFNSRNFNPTNINKIISLCDYLMIDNTEKFILTNMEYSKNKYILDSCHKNNYNYFIKIFDNIVAKTCAHHGMLKYLKKIQITTRIKT